ncbi:hypothetical protein [Actinospica robiniae]|uniref:hypothetical protein n=1 Tax=Actinospica robiniae TaxID=304901 RepID=UPI0012FC35F3|nr:hypothetical protein [Actinospica robiniae]
MNAVEMTIRAANMLVRLASGRLLGRFRQGAGWVFLDAWRLSDYSVWVISEDLDNPVKVGIVFVVHRPTP